MKNPWEEINLHDYEGHMSLDSVMQLQTMNKIMRDQFYRYAVTTAMVLGIAGGNGLHNIKPERFKKVYGVDINQAYLQECVERYPTLRYVFTPIQCDLQSETIVLPEAELAIANLIIEYVGYRNFQRAIQCIKPQYVSCVIQINTDDSFVSNSPYRQVFDRLDEVHRKIDKIGVIKSMGDIGYRLLYETDYPLPNGKEFLRFDFKN